MAHFAELDENNIVKQVVVVNNQAIRDENAVEQESLGIILCKQLHGENTRWVQTSYTAGNGVQYARPNAFRKNFACIGAEYRQDLDAFITLKPFDSWVLNETNCVWEAPVPYPSDGRKPVWNDSTKTWNDDNGVLYNWKEQQQSWVIDPFQ